MEREEEWKMAQGAGAEADLSSVQYRTVLFGGSPCVFRVYPSRRERDCRNIGRSVFSLAIASSLCRPTPCCLR